VWSGSGRAGAGVHRVVAESMRTIGHNLETMGAWGGPSVSAPGEALVAPGVYLLFLIVVGMVVQNCCLASSVL
jgi:hypothetical protein